MMVLISNQALTQKDAFSQWQTKVLHSSIYELRGLIGLVFFLSTNGGKMLRLIDFYGKF